MDVRLIKKALELKEPSGPLAEGSSALAKTVGRLAVLPKSVLVGQERFLDYLTDYDKKELADQLKDFKKDPRFRDTVVRLAHSNLAEDYDRLAKSEDLGPVTKTIGKAVLPIAALSTSLRRSTHYNPFSDTISVYGRSPEIIKQEFLRALKYKKDPSDKDLVGIAKGQLLDPKNPSSNPEEYRRRTWPLNVGLWGGLLAGLATLHPDVRNYADEQLSGLNVTDSDLLNKIIRKGALGLGAVGSGALLGRAAAETTNLMNRNVKQAFINGFVKRAAEHGFDENEAKNLLKNREEKDSGIISHLKKYAPFYITGGLVLPPLLMGLYSNYNRINTDNSNTEYPEARENPSIPRSEESASDSGSRVQWIDRKDSPSDFKSWKDDGKGVLNPGSWKSDEKGVLNPGSWKSDEKGVLNPGSWKSDGKNPLDFKSWKDDGKGIW